MTYRPSLLKGSPQLLAHLIVGIRRLDRATLGNNLLRSERPLSVSPSAILPPRLDFRNLLLEALLFCFNVVAGHCICYGGDGGSEIRQRRRDAGWQWHAKVSKIAGNGSNGSVSGVCWMVVLVKNIDLQGCGLCDSLLSFQSFTHEVEAVAVKERRCVFGRASQIRDDRAPSCPESSRGHSFPPRDWRQFSIWPSWRSCMYQ